MSLVIGAGWPVSVVVGLALPVALRLGYEGVAFMTVGVADSWPRWRSPQRGAAHPGSGCSPSPAGG
ncbi:MAG: hypothetical protein M3075_08605 [Candidatus Dormibacteraeota bacterium]|jgi:hypothetical protein|nr:hypothetical protein [Candidatus Dormibacteraeota bacterium]